MKWKITKVNESTKGIKRQENFVIEKKIQKREEPKKKYRKILSFYDRKWEFVGWRLMHPLRRVGGRWKEIT